MPRKYRTHMGFSMFAGLFFLMAVQSCRAEDLVYQRLDPSNPQFIQEFKQITLLRGHQDLEGLVQLANKIQIQWSNPKKSNIYFELSDAVVEAIASCDTPILGGPDCVQILARKYALLALHGHGQVPLDVAVHLVTRLAYQDEADYSLGIAQGDAWSQLRTERMKDWFGIWNRLDAAKNDQQLHKGLIANIPFPMGDDPNNPADQAAWTKLVKDNNEKIEEDNAQLEVRSLYQDYVPFAENTIVLLYSLSPYNTNELKDYLSTLKDKSIQDDILKQVRESKLKR